MLSTILRNNARARSTDGGMTVPTRSATPPRVGAFAILASCLAGAGRTPEVTRSLFDIIAWTVAPVRPGLSQKQTGRLGRSRPVQLSATDHDQRQTCTVRIW
jgi:hypothetical protein